MVDWGTSLNKYDILMIDIFMLNFHGPIRFCKAVSFLAEKLFKSRQGD